MSPAPFVQLIGSVPVDTAEEAMRIACENLPDRLFGLADGETGERHMFVLWQVRKIWPEEVLAHKPAWNNVPPPGSEPDKFALKTEHLPSTTGYAEHAIASYKLFCSMRDSGVIPQGIKFQVCVPSPATVVGLTLRADYQVVGEQMYEELLYADLKAIQESIPHHDLAIQWDMLAEPAFMEHAYGEVRHSKNWFFAQLRPFFEPVREGVASRMARQALAIEHDVDMGLHFCYGDADQKHYVQPTDSALLAELIDIALKNMSRPVKWAHVPVPAERTDEAYFNALKSLDLGKTNLVLGLVHAHDDQGTKERMAKAQKVLPGVAFGISTECGMGRTPKKDLLSILKICRDNTKPH